MKRLLFLLLIISISLQNQAFAQNDFDIREYTFTPMDLLNASGVGTYYSSGTEYYQLGAGDLIKSFNPGQCIKLTPLLSTRQGGQAFFELSVIRLAGARKTGTNPISFRVEIVGKNSSNSWVTFSSEDVRITSGVEMSRNKSIYFGYMDNQVIKTGGSFNGPFTELHGRICSTNDTATFDTWRTLHIIQLSSTRLIVVPDLKSKRIEEIRLSAISEEVSVRSMANSAIVHKISFEATLKSVESSACTIASNQNNPFFDQTQALSIFQAAFGHTDWQTYSQNCDSVPVNITSFDQCTEGSAEVHCQNRAAYFAVKASLDAKRSLLESWQTELVSLGDDSVRASIESIKNATIIK